MVHGRSPRSFDVPCTVRVSHTPHELGAHVELDGDIELGPGDEVRVHGEAIHPPFGQAVVLRRLATVTRASRIRRLWVRWTGNLGCLELLDINLSERSHP